MAKLEEKDKSAEKFGRPKLEVFIFGLFLAAVMFGLGFLMGSRWGERKAAESSAPQVIRLIPPPVEILPPTMENTETEEQEVTGQVWEILTGEEASPPTSQAGASASRPAQAAPPPASTASNDVREPPQAISGSAGPNAASFYSVQLMSIKSEKKAEDTVKALARKGYPAPRVVKTEISGRGTWYRVRVGRFEQKGEAEKWAKDIGQKERLKPSVVLEQK